jgi:rare lipoprotein A
LPKLSLARHRASFGLLVFGSIALVGAQQALGKVANAQTTQAAVVDVHTSRPAGSAQPDPAQANFVTAAVSRGQFEEVFSPIPAPTQMPAADPDVLAPEPAPEPPPAPEPTPFQSGIASTYGEGDGFEGRRTACGQIFHTGVVQIAHKTLPCGTKVRVVDTSTGNSVDARVTDRGPYIPGRVVDLSWGAFKQLDPAGPGLLHVDVYLVDEE